MTVPQNTYKVACAMDFIDKQILPPKSWVKFEDLTRALFAAVWRSPLTQKNGRSGQKQQGVDVYGTPQATPGIKLAEALSQRSPSFYNESLMFLRLLVQVQSTGLIRVLDQIDVNRATLGWRNALRGQDDSREPGA